ncbi:hypothetical protein GGR44_001293 [Sphingobium fontiphilum]|uniref:SAM-dependent methyltransferase n=1 Tax=Sphingobium fontiphilum TaxID=944425 RepID=A0A7W6GMV5_9SPHN|nr:DUF938 domain-containing protein [Sphingobium fontiphilum]MBB3981646.1 hypothetical protein [Sphingobium fontiphilum]
MTARVPGEAAAAQGRDARRHAPATARNRDAILAVLLEVLPPSGLVLEVASGSGEHVVHFAQALPLLAWQPTDPDPAAIASVAAWAGHAKRANIRAPLTLDAASPDWPVQAADAIMCINMTHISPWAATVGLFTQGARLLPKGAPLILYGPYFREGCEPAPSNLAFDESLRARNAEWGIRWLEDVSELAQGQGFALEAVHEMPANNLTLVYRRG